MPQPHQGCPTRNLPAEAIEMAVASNLASLASNPAMMRVLQERLPQLAHRDISEALTNVEQLWNTSRMTRSQPSSKLSTRG